MAQVTLGQSPTPHELHTYFDALYSSSMVNYKKGFQDNIGAENAAIDAIMKSGAYKGYEGGAAISEGILYGFGTAEPYGSYDKLPENVTDGATRATYTESNIATVVMYSDQELNTNAKKIDDLVELKMKQGQMAMQESFSQHFMWGNKISGGNLTDPYVGSGGARSLDPLAKIISYGTSASAGTALTIGGINENTYPWWRNREIQSAADTYRKLLTEFTRMVTTCNFGAGGKVDIILIDQVTSELLMEAYYKVFKNPMGVAGSDDKYPFEYRTFMGAKVIVEDKMPDIHSGTLPAIVGGVGSPTSLTYGSAYFINSKMLGLQYLQGADFEMMKDQNGKTFQKPYNAAYRIGHIGWSGAVTVQARRKLGVIGKIARTLTD